MDKTHRSRRSALGILATGPIALLPALAVMQCSARAEATVIGRSAWSIAFERWQKADRLADDYLVKIYNPAMAELDQRAPFTLPWFEVRAMDGKVATFRFDSDNPNEWDDHMSPQFRNAAAEVRTKVQARAAAWDDMNFSSLEDESDRLLDEVGDAEYLLMKTPAPDPVALLWKVERMFGDEDGHRSFNEEVQQAFLADARRLLSAGRA